MIRVATIAWGVALPAPGNGELPGMRVAGLDLQHSGAVSFRSCKNVEILALGVFYPLAWEGSDYRLVDLGKILPPLRSMASKKEMESKVHWPLHQEPGFPTGERICKCQGRIDASLLCVEDQEARLDMFPTLKIDRGRREYVVDFSGDHVDMPITSDSPSINNSMLFRDQNSSWAESRLPHGHRLTDLR